jgi:DNA-binding HxlR family transcriptional regulator
MAHAAELVGERWALLVVRELLLGPKRFTDLRAGIPRVSPNVLGQRLRELEAAGVVRRHTLPPPAGSRVYELTDWGRELEPVALGLGAWAARSPVFPHEGSIGPDSLVLAFKAIFDPDRAKGVEATLAIVLDGQSYGVSVAGGAIEVGRDVPAEPDATIVTDSETLSAVVIGGADPAEAVDQGRLTITGSRGALDDLVRVVRQPEPAPGPQPASA